MRLAELSRFDVGSISGREFAKDVLEHSLRTLRQQHLEHDPLKLGQRGNNASCSRLAMIVLKSMPNSQIV